MSIIDEQLKKNETYAQSFRLGNLPAPPARRLAVVTCMDARLNIEQALGLQTGDAHIIRNAGGIVTDDVLRSLILSHHLLGTREIMIINHTGCGLLTFTDADLKARLAAETGVTAPTPESFLPFPNLEENVRAGMARIQLHPWVPGEVTVRGFIYDVQSGKLAEVK